jgi:hypothetical protein
LTYSSGSKDEYKYAVTDTKFAFSNAPTYNMNNAESYIYDISISSDGKTLILSYPSSSDSRYVGVWLTKK